MRYPTALMLYFLSPVPLVFTSPLLARQVGSLEWAKCDTIGNTTVPVTCATLAVPRDYTKPDSTKTIDLKLVKHAASEEPFKGSLLINPGGPGFAGRNLLAGGYKMMRAFESSVSSSLGFLANMLQYCRQPTRPNQLGLPRHRRHTAFLMLPNGGGTISMVRGESRSRTQFV